MAYDIQAWLAADGRPCLQLLDAETHRVRLTWAAGTDQPAAIKSLFRDLILISAGDRLATAASEPKPAIPHALVDR